MPLFSTGFAVSILEFPTFSGEADKLLTREELDDLRSFLAFHPEAGDRIPGTGGIRKLRVGVEKKGKGKRGGARVIYYFHSPKMPLALLALYAKGEKADLSEDEKKELRNLIHRYVAAFGG
ncbi:type II toxin-antitoxin system RelE/ParE family toxin [Novispirillum itersonii]|uniref:mRNA-degrading endonuclease RelE of RelBE toxin-antitoxin system n=1 Tax=Novispirillum itersonii TaxID=189 RepID=A0A7W9ZIZ8_NOVIT|nr:type II toxin-antitoxin system RelE/ParE family toxin [Novispirillum itersonii]MBB6212407.1 mRNA-degrading endonuclease RelE of RelBE toxin-antitoxin system [Novispirillum itersonii]